MKLLLLLCLLLGGLRDVHGQWLYAGTREVKIGGLIDFRSIEGTLMAFEGAYGIYLWPYTEVLAGLQWRDSDLYSAWIARLAIEYNWDFGTLWVPYAGAGPGYGSASIRQDRKRDSRNVFLVHVLGGIKYFLSDEVALSGSLRLERAADKFFPKKRGATRTDARFDLALRVHF